eukprot:gene23699-28724_t
MVCVASSLHGMSWCREYDSEKKAWTFPAAKLEEVTAALTKANGMLVTVAPLPTFQKRAMAIKLANDSSAYERIPKDMEAKMFPFQRDGVRFALRHGGRVLFGDEMGLGKTIQAIATLACYQEDWPCLLVVPSSLRSQWASALHQWLHIRESDIKVIHTCSPKDRPLLDRTFNIVSYNFMHK